MSRLLEVADLCSSTVSDPANRLRKTRKKKSSAVPLFRSGRRSLVCARLGSKGKVGVQRGRKTAGCPSFLPTAVGTASPPRRAPRRSRRPQTANPPLRFSGKLPARQGRTRLRQFACPAQPMQKRSRPLGANPPAAVRVPRSAGAAKGAARKGRTRLRQFVCPGQPVQKRSRPSGANPSAAVRVPWSPCAEKRKAPQNCFHGAQSMHFYSNRSSVSTSLRAGACGSCAG